MKPQNKTPSAQSDALFEKAFFLLHSKQLPEAQIALKTLLKSFPGHPLLLTGLGNIAIETGDFNNAVLLLEKSLKADPLQVDALLNLGISLAMLKRPEQAVTFFNRLISIKPDSAEAFNNRGNVYMELNLTQDAVDSYLRAIALKADYIEAIYNLGNAMLSLQLYNEAISQFERVIALQPDFPAAYNNLGKAQMSLHMLDNALANFNNALTFAPNFDDALNNRETALRLITRIDTALNAATPSANLTSHDTVTLVHHGNTLKDRGQNQGALKCLELAVTLSPQDPVAYYNLGLALLELSHYEAALAAYNQCLAIKPDLVDAYNNRGNTLQYLLRYEEAIKDYDTALSFNPGMATPHNNRAFALQILRRFDAALADYDQAIALRPGYADAYWNKSLLKIVTGDYLEGWRLYEWRWQALQGAQLRNYAQPLWLGDSPVAGKSILIYPEQGLGDFIQFCRYASHLEALGANVIIEAPPSLIPVLATLKGQFTLISYGNALPHFDLHCPIASFPLAFKTTVETIPADVPYLYANSEKQKICHDRLGKKTGLRVGLVWSGSPGHKSDNLRSIPLKLFEPILNLPIEFHSLQTEIRDGDAEILANFKNLHVHRQEISDFSDTAALINEMDVVISVDTSVAHLTGALAKPVWILLAYSPDYRWLLDRTDCPWYPTATLIRQSVLGDWTSVIPELIERLTALKPGKTSTKKLPVPIGEV